MSKLESVIDYKLPIDNHQSATDKEFDGNWNAQNGNVKNFPVSNRGSESDLVGLLDSEKNGEDEEVEIGLSVKRWLVLFVFCQITLANGAMWITFPSISNIVTDYYRVDYYIVNWFSMAYLLGYAILALPASTFLSSYGVKACILVAASLNGAGACLRYAGVDRDRFAFVIIGQIFAAIASAFVLQVPPKLAAVWFGEHEKAKATSIGVLMNLAGVAVGFIQPTLLVRESKDMDIVRQGMDYLLSSQALFCIGCLVLTYIFVDERPKLPPSRSEALRERKSVLHLSLKKSITILFRSKSFNLTSQAYGIQFGILTGFSTLLNELMKTKYDFVPDSSLGMLGFTGTIIGSIFTFIAGILLDKFQRYKETAIVLFLSATLTMGGFAVVLLYLKSFPLLATMFCLFNAAALPFLGCGLEQIAEITYPVEEDISCSFPLIFGNLYGFVAVYLFGWLIEKGLVQVVFILIISSLATGLLLVIIAKVPMRRTEADHSLIN